jgi:hypothetical protein
MISLVKRVYVQYPPLGVGTHKGANGITLQKDSKSFFNIFHCVI